MNDTMLGLIDILALDRTRLAAEHTLMGWIRTSFSMMTFGFTIYKVMQELGQISAPNDAPVSESRHLGLALAAIGTVALMIACVQHWRYTRQLIHDQVNTPLGFDVGRHLPGRLLRAPHSRRPPSQVWSLRLMATVRAAVCCPRSDQDPPRSNLPITNPRRTTTRCTMRALGGLCAQRQGPLSYPIRAYGAAIRDDC